MRLAKFLAHAGVASRRAAEGLIAHGRVRVAGEVVSDLIGMFNASSIQIKVSVGVTFPVLELLTIALYLFVFRPVTTSFPRF